MRLSQVTCVLIHLDDSDIPPLALKAFASARDPLIAKPLVVANRLIPRDFDELDELSVIRFPVDGLGTARIPFGSR